MIETMTSTQMLSRAGAHVPALLLCAALSVASLSAQTTPHPAPKSTPKLWQGRALANASVFFGNTQQQVFGADAKLARVDSAFGIAGELQSVYGEASTNSAPRIVTKRIWMGTLTANFRPLARVSGFVTGSYQSNLEKRIASRYSVGGGAKWNIHQTSTTDAGLSLALSGEHTVARDSTVSFPEQWIARFSWGLTFHHSFDDRVRISHSTSWQPAANAVSQYLVASSTELRLKMNSTVSLSVVFTDNYDSGAMSRGSRTNNDGQTLFGISAGL
jgi:hypothetical protein